MSRFTDIQDHPKFSVTVSSDIGEYTKSDVLTKPMDIADYFRVMFAEGAKEGEETFNGDDDVIIDIAMAVPHPKDMDDEAWEIEVLQALESRNRSNDPITTPLPDMRSDDVVKATTGSTATAEGERLDKNERFRTELHTAGDAPIKVKRASLELLVATLMEHGYQIKPDGELTKHEGHLDNFPRPGSMPLNAEGKMDRKWRPKQTERNKYAEYYINAGTDSLKYDWYVALVQATAEGKAIVKELNEFQESLPTKSQKSSGKYKKEKPSWIRGKKRLLTERLNGMVRAMKLAVSCYYQMKDINTDPIISKNAGARFLFQHPGLLGNSFNSITDSVEPIEVYNKVLVGPMEGYTVSGFNNLDLAVALEKEGTYYALIESTAREPNKKKSKIWELDNYMDNYSLLAELMNTAFINKLMSKANEIDKSTRARTEEAENIILAHCKIVDELMPFYNIFGSEIRQKILVRQQDKTHELSKEFVPAKKAG